MRIIKYKDRINKVIDELEVSDEVAKFLQANDRKLRRKQAQYDYYNQSLNESILDDGSTTLEDIIPVPEEEVMNCKTCKAKIDFYNIIWRVVENLDKEKYDLIWDLFVVNKTQKQIAKKLNISESAVSQLKDTAIDDLVYHFNYSEEFKETEFYINYIEREKYDFNRIASQLTTQEIGQYVMNGALAFSKTLTQIIKKSTILIKDIKDKENISKVNRIVKPVLQELNLDNSKNKVLNICEDLFNDENIELIKNNVLKFFI